MGKSIVMLEDYLVTILQKDDIRVDEFTLRPALKSIKTREVADLKTCYHLLGGRTEDLPLFTFNCRAVIGKSIIFVDDHSHFNRYRNMTLRSALYNHIPGYPKANYQRYCRLYEKECLKSGMRAGVWSSKTAEKYFGAASDPGDFFPDGAPGWKLQAYKDYLRDLAVFSSGHQVIPVSVYDNLLVEGKLIKIGAILSSRHSHLESALLQYLKRKMAEGLKGQNQ